jgi:hypothetical protein
MRFFAQADKQTNQKSAPFTPTGWGESLLQALSECVRAIHRFPYEGDGLHNWLRVGGSSMNLRKLM